MKLANVMKLARKVTSPEQLLDLLSGLGVDVEYKPIAPGSLETMQTELAEVATAAAAAGNKLYSAVVKSDSGHKATLLVVLHPVAK